MAKQIIKVRSQREKMYKSKATLQAVSTQTSVRGKFRFRLAIANSAASLGCESYNGGYNIDGRRDKGNASGQRLSEHGTYHTNSC